jgi:AIG1 family
VFAELRSKGKQEVTVLLLGEPAYRAVVCTKAMMYIGALCHHCAVYIPNATTVSAGKNGVGKSSTANSLLNEQAFQVAPFQQDVGRPTRAARSMAGFRFRIIDTPGLVDGDTVNERVSRLGKRRLVLMCAASAEHTLPRCALLNVLCQGWLQEG